MKGIIMKIKSSLIVFAAAAMLSLGAEHVRTEILAGKEYPFFARVDNDLYYFNRLPQERGTVKFTKKADALCITTAFKDSDVVAESTADQTMLNKTGDAIQIFLKPENETFVWEIFVDPNNHKSCFFHWGLGRMFYTSSDKAEKPAVSVKTAKGDGFWNAEILFPFSEVRKYGLNFSDKEEWTVMVVRTNYSKHLAKKELSSYPQAVKDFANPIFFGRLVLDK